MQDCVKFMGCSLALNLLIFITAYLMHYIILFEHEGSTADIILQLLRFVLNSLPPLLGSLLVTLRFVTVLRLRRQNIFLSDTRKLQTASQLDLVLFDKTGTLTVGQVRFRNNFSPPPPLFPPPLPFPPLAPPPPPARPPSAFALPPALSLRPFYPRVWSPPPLPLCPLLSLPLHLDPA